MEEKKEETKKKGGRPKGSTNKKNQIVIETPKTILEQINSNEKNIGEFSGLEYFNELNRVYNESCKLKEIAKVCFESRSSLYTTISILFKFIESTGEDIQNIRNFFNSLYPQVVEKEHKENKEKEDSTSKQTDNIKGEENKEEEKKGERN